MILDESTTHGQTTHIDIHPILMKHKRVFDDIPPGLPPKRGFEHSIELEEGAKPVITIPYRHPHKFKEEIEKTIKELLEMGHIQPSCSPFASSVVLVKKKDGTMRMCIDYRSLNKKTIKNRYPIPRIDELMDELHGAKYFSKIDLRSRYHQIRMRKEDVPKTAFHCHYGHFEFLVLPFGLTNAPATFQSCMNHIFRQQLRKFLLIFFDDILIYSKTWEEHLKHIKEVLNILESESLYAKMSKCEFGLEEIIYLGHKISEKGVSVDEEKIKVVRNWPTPKTLTQLRGFVGLCSYYRRFVKGFSKIAAPLTDLTKKGAFTWNEKAQIAFDQLKITMSSCPVLAIPDFSIPFELQCDASGEGIGAVLMQRKHPIAFESRKLTDRERLYSIYYKKMLAIMHALVKFRQYLVCGKFLVKTDHNSLRFFLSQKDLNDRQQKWVSKIQAYDFDIEYVKGTNNGVADALSRKAHLNTLTSISKDWKEEITKEYDQDAQAQEIIKGNLPSEDYKIKNNLIYYKGRILLTPQSEFKKKILKEFHDNPLAGHQGYYKTYKHI